jgi:integrase
MRKPRKKEFPPRPAKAHSSGQARVTIAGKAFYLGPFGSGEAEDEYIKLRSAFYADAKAFEQQTGADGTVGELRRQFLAWVELHLAKDTHRFYASHTRMLEEACGTLRACELRQHHLTPAVDRQLRTGAWGPFGEFNAKRACYRVFEWAREQGILEKNPLKGMKWSQPPPRQRSMTEDEYIVLLKGSGIAFRQLLFALRHTGARPGELRKLTWNQIRGDRIVISNHKTRGMQKVKRDRIIHLTPTMQRFLLYIRKIAAKERGDLLDIGKTYVFLNNRGGAWTTASIDEQMRRLKKRLGLADDVCAYLLRHAWATASILNGVSVATTAELMGNSPAMVSQVYSHLADHHQHLAAEMERASRRPTG